MTNDNANVELPAIIFDVALEVFLNVHHVSRLFSVSLATKLVYYSEGVNACGIVTTTFQVFSALLQCHFCRLLLRLFSASYFLSNTCKFYTTSQQVLTETKSKEKSPNR